MTNHATAIVPMVNFLGWSAAPSDGGFDLGPFLLWRGSLPNAESAFYFSGVTYTTLGYGDLVLAKPWRLLAPIEGLMGVLMCGLSTGCFFVVLSRVHQSRHEKSTAASRTE